MRRNLAYIVSLVLLLVFSGQAGAQSAVEVIDAQVTYTFGEEVFFSARIRSQSPIQEAYLLFKAEADQNTHMVLLTLAEDGTVEYKYAVQSGMLRPFASIVYWYRLRLASGETIDSSNLSFQYNDNRYSWQTLEESGLNIHWYTGDAAFGQAALDAAQAGQQAIQNMIPIAAGDPVNIYIYASATDVQSALNLGGFNWVGGHASPDLGVVLVSVAPSLTQSIEMERQIPHELAHVLLYRQIGPAYANLPSWLLEGIASQAERYPNSDYAQVLSIATQNSALVPITDLCGAFPADASGAILAYVESDAFTRYLRDTYGTTGLQALIQSYSGGLDCEQGARRALGLTLTQLDLGWRQATLGENGNGVALQNLLPYFGILILILIVPAWRLGLDYKKKEHPDERKAG